MKTILSLLGSLALLPQQAFAQTAEDGVLEAALATSDHWALGLAFLGAGMATAIPCYGSSIGVSIVGQAGSGLITEKPDMAGRVITLSVIPGSQGLYGMVISLLFLFNYAPPILSGSVALTMADGVALFGAFIPVTIACLGSSPYQGKVCAAGMHLLAKDSGLMGRVITLAALVETYALLGFLISFFMLNALKDSILS
ncbi:MAG: V-type ATP synthase subunit K [Verrucomicrobiales bacterium]